jgi:hypothetical protein
MSPVACRAGRDIAGRLLPTNIIGIGGDTPSGMP